MPEPDAAALTLDAIVARFEYVKRLGDGALAQLDDAQLHESVGHDVNPVAVVARHVAGNLTSRWTDFLTADGEKPSRDRDAEFDDDGLGRAAVLERWEAGWAVLFGALRALTPGDMTRTVRIRGEPHSVPLAALRSLDHIAYHVGQIVLIAKTLRGADWRTLTVPRGGTRAFNESLGFDPRNPDAP